MTGLVWVSLDLKHMCIHKLNIESITFMIKWLLHNWVEVKVQLVVLYINVSNSYMSEFSLADLASDFPNYLILDTVGNSIQLVVITCNMIALPLFDHYLLHRYILYIHTYSNMQCSHVKRQSVSHVFDWFQFIVSCNFSDFQLLSHSVSKG